MKLNLKLIVLNDQEMPFMGKGGRELLQGIERLGSINKAAKEMGLSYAKALKIIKKIETNLHGQVLKRQIGGKEHGGAELTPLAVEFIEIYIAYEKEVTAFAQERFLAVDERLRALVEKSASAEDGR
ncbi:MAG: LysR family transcriptional regulator [Deltaproteobacteria bacterium]|nr:LysR family transcriptional regulator [Deltaproteobacteria bacterium]